VVAAAVDAERHAEPAGAHAEHCTARTEVPLGVNFHQPNAPAVGIRRAEYIAARRIDAGERLADDR
jgi:hypothetical protein